jgi:intraflagellar transport protein 80
MSIGYGNLVANTASQCYIYNIPNWNTPHIFDLKDSVAFIIQSQKYFCLI